MPHQHIHTDWMLQFGTTTQFCNDAIRRELVKEMCMIQGSCDVSIIKYWFQFQIHIYWQASIYKSLCKQLIWWMPWEHLRIEIKTAKSPAAGEMSSSRGHWAGAGVLVKGNGCGHSQKRRYLTQALARRFFIVMTAGKKVARGSVEQDVGEGGYFRRKQQRQREEDRNCGSVLEHWLEWSVW